MKLIYRISKSSYIKVAMMHYNPKAVFNSFITAVTMGIVMISIGYANHTFQIGYLIALILDLAVFLLAIWFYRNIFQRQIERLTRQIGNDYFDEDITIELFQNDFSIKSLIRESKQIYSTVKSVKEDHNYVYLTFIDNGIISIPTAEIRNPENKDAFLSELKEKIAKRP